MNFHEARQLPSDAGKPHDQLSAIITSFNIYAGSQHKTDAKLFSLPTCTTLRRAGREGWLSLLLKSSMLVLTCIVLQTSAATTFCARAKSDGCFNSAWLAPSLELKCRLEWWQQPPATRGGITYVCMIKTWCHVKWGVKFAWDMPEMPTKRFPWRRGEPFFAAIWLIREEA